MRTAEQQELGVLETIKTLFRATWCGKRVSLLINPSWPIDHRTANSDVPVALVGSQPVGCVSLP
ncbi:MAG: hypothetical protein KA354_08515 [Phycisphaerae bacterium]|nr:hypothetical protein [Phycisphaerae bacterium]